MATAVNAQNLVPNPGFETITNPFCGIAGAGDFDNAFANWSSATSGTPDPFFDNIAQTCFNFQPNSTYPGPIGIKGSQLPRSGNAMAGAFMYTIPTFNQRDYIQVEFTSPLAINGLYAVEFYVSLADSTENSTSNIGAHLSTTTIFQAGDGVLLAVPQVEANAVISDDQTWTQIIDTITALEAYTHLTIGNFYDDNSTTLVPNPTASGAPGTYGSYYFIDDIRVERVFIVGTPENNLENIAVFPNPFNSELTINASSSIDHYSLEIRDAMGRLVIQNANLIGTNTIATEMLSKGLYYVKINAEGNSITRKFVK